MFKLNLKIALRNLWKYKGYTAINVLGLSVGLAGCLLIFIFLRYQLSFDKNYKDNDRIYRVVSSWTYPAGESYSQGVPKPLSSAMRQDFTQLEKVATIRNDGGTIKAEKQVGKEEVKDNEMFYYIEPEFFDIFGIEWLAGKPSQALSEPNATALSEETAVKYFGSWQNALNKSIKLNNKIDFKVTGIFKDFPQNSSFPFKILMSYASFDERNEKDWGSVTSGQECYVKLKKGVHAEDLKKPMESFVNKYYVEKGPGKEHHSFQPLSEVHYSENYGNYSYKTMPKAQITGLVVIGLFLLVTACINFINMATAQAISRSKEVGVRKVMGSRRKQLIWQFLSETLLITLVALLLACVITELSIPGMKHLFGQNISFSLFAHSEIYVFMLVLIIAVSFLAGLYPALVMSGFSPALAIKNKISTANAGGIGLRKALVVAQFAITAILIIGTLAVVKQMRFMREKSLGFDSGGIALIQMPSDSISKIKYSILADLILKQPGVKSLSYCSAAPSSSNNNETSFTFNSTEDADFQVNTKSGDENYVKTFGMSLIAGRDLTKSDTIKEFLVNETLLKKLNVPDPQQALGKIMELNGRSGPVVGVVKDFNNYSLHEEIAPIAIYTSKRSSLLAVKMEQGQILNTMKFVKREWNRAYPDDVYDVTFMEDSINNFYETERVMGILFKVFAGVVIFISFIGLFGLISFVATQRTREIAIRKVLGASTMELVKMLNSSFLWMVLIANLVAWPVAYIFVSKWLDGFAYRAPMSVWPFVLAMAISIMITLITVSIRSYRAARSNPIDALKYE